MLLITSKRASKFSNYSVLPFRNWCLLVRMTIYPSNCPVIHEAPADGVASPRTGKQDYEPPLPRGVTAQATHRRKTESWQRIWRPTQEFSLVFQRKVSFLCGRVWWIFLISLLSALGSKQHILFHSLWCFINNKIASVCLSCKYLDIGSCL